MASESTTSDDGNLLRFTAASVGRAPYVDFEVPHEIVLRCNPHAEIRAALADAFGSALDAA